MRLSVAVLLLASFVRADPVTDAADAADAVLAAFDAKDPAKLKEWAAKDIVDPWRVAEELCVRGKHDAAEAFAKAAPRKHVEKLPAYVASLRGKPADPRRQNIEAAYRAIRANKPRAAGEALANLDVSTNDMNSARIMFGRSWVLRLSGRMEQGARAFRNAGDALARLGWYTQAAQAYHNSAACCEDRKDWRGALAMFGRLLEMQESLSNRRGIADVLHWHGAAHEKLGDHRRAASFRQRAVKLSGQLNDERFLAGGLAVLAFNWESVAEFPKAIRCYERALSLYNNLGDAGKAGQMLVELSDVHEKIGDHRKALSLAAEGLKLAERANDRKNQGHALNSLATACRRLGRFREAVTYQTRGLKLAYNRTVRAAYLINMGSAYKGLKELDVAVKWYERGLTEARAAGAQAFVAAALTNIGAAHALLGNWDESLAYLKRALALARRLGHRRGIVKTLQQIAWTHMRVREFRKALDAAHRAFDEMKVLVSGLSDLQGAKAREVFGSIFEIGVGAALVLGDPTEMSFFMEAGRAGALLETLRLGDVVIPGELRRAVDAARREYDKAVTLAARKTARIRLEKSIDRIQQEAKAGSRLAYPEPDSLAAIQANLAEGEVFVQYHRVYGTAESYTAVLVASKNEAHEMLLADLDKTAAWDKAAAQLMALTRGGRVRGLELEKTTAPRESAVARLKELLVEPLKLPPGCRRVLVSPYGRMAYLPLQLLFGEREVVYVDSGTTYNELKKRGAKKGKGVLVLADPAYAELPRLPGSLAEAEAIGTKVLSGAGATKKALRSALDRTWRSVHFACHGLLNAQDPRLSSLALAGSELSVLEVYAMKVSADLVVLSACETGKGEVYRAEGVMGFTRAFMFAGAPRVIVSLWKVDDDATKALMVRFYELWKTEPTATALKKAQEYVASHKQWKHPYYWAAWQLWGLPD